MIYYDVIMIMIMIIDKIIFNFDYNFRLIIYYDDDLILRY
jgi:hypothetical protein